MFYKVIERIAPFLALSPLILMVSLLLNLSGIVSFQCSGLGVDADGRIYVGKSDVICVYENGSLVNELDPQTSRGYAFVVTEENTILLSTSTVVHSMDLDGNVLTSYEDVGAKTIGKLERARGHFEGADGRTYSMSSKLGYYTLVRDDGVTVYRMPALDYCFLLLTIFSVIAFFFLIICVIIIAKSDDGENNPPFEKIKFEW